jgi:hypothetical protein
MTILRHIWQALDALATQIYEIFHEIGRNYAHQDIKKTDQTKDRE